jgi:glyoxylase-like metal-dependent hydrolase (beta-lactamase superfamily II)
MRIPGATAAALGLIVLLAAAPLLGQGPSPASALIDEAVAFVGGRARLLAVRTLVVEGYGKNPNIGQAMTPEAEPLFWMLPDYRRATDLATGRTELSFTRRPAFPAVFDNARQVQRLDGDVAVLHHPLALLRAALEPGARLENVRPDSQRRVDIVTAAGDRLTLAVDALGRPVSIASAVYHPNLGDTTRVTTFDSWEELDGVKLPKRLVTTLDRWVEYEIGVMKNTLDAELPELAAPAPARAAPAAAAAPTIVTTELAPGIWFLTGGGVPNLVVEFADHVTIIETGSEARFLAVLATARELVPGKPVTEVVVSHHHFDHTGGLRAAVAEGLTVITHRVNQAWFREAVGRRHSIVRDALARNPRPLQLFAVDDTHVIRDSAMELALYHLAGSTHGDGLLAAYFPRERLFVEADVWNPGARIQPHVQSLAAEIARRQLAIDRVVPLHGQQVQPYSELEKTLAEWAGRRSTTTTDVPPGGQR